MTKLTSAHMGNGITVWREGTNNIVAHISVNREVTVRANDVTTEEKKVIFHIAKTDDRRISTTQEEKVFNTRPKT